MEAAIIISGVVSQGAFIGVAAFFVKRWMDKVEVSIRDNREERNQQMESNRKETTEAARSLASDLKQTVVDHKREILDHNKEVNDNLSAIFEQLRIANGRTAKIEGGLHTVERLCAERHGK